MWVLKKPGGKIVLAGLARALLQSARGQLRRAERYRSLALCAAAVLPL